MTFDEWLTTADGQNCAAWPVDGKSYLINRLWWAYQAGATKGKDNSERPISAPKTIGEPK